jgi:hypothetical protein
VPSPLAIEAWHNGGSHFVLGEEGYIKLLRTFGGKCVARIPKKLRLTESEEFVWDAIRDVGNIHKALVTIKRTLERGTSA